MYNLYKTGVDNEKLLKKLLLDVSRSTKKLLKESITFVIILEFI